MTDRTQDQSTTQNDGNKPASPTFPNGEDEALHLMARAGMAPLLPRSQNAAVMSRTIPWRIDCDRHTSGKMNVPCPWCALEAEQFDHAGTREHLRLAREEIATLERRIYLLNADSGKTGPT